MDTAAAPRKRFDLVAYLKLFRFPLVFTAIADSAAGYLIICGDHQPVVPRTMLLLAATSGCLYLFGMALNDIADFEKDRQFSPKKVLPSGRISLSGARVAASFLLVLSFVAVVLVEGPSLSNRLLVWGLTLASILAYDLHWIKFASIMGLVRALNCMLGMTAAERISLSDDKYLSVWVVLIVVTPLFTYVSSLTYVSTLEDAALDRRKLLVGAGGMALGALSAGCILPLLEYVSFRTLNVRFTMTPGMIAAGLLVGWIWRRVKVAKDRMGVMMIVRDGVAGIVLVDAALVLSSGNLERGLGIATLLVPAALSLAIFKRLA